MIKNDDKYSIDNTYPNEKLILRNSLNKNSNCDNTVSKISSKMMNEKCFHFFILKKKRGIK